jgi:hypothetical protein
MTIVERVGQMWDRSLVRAVFSAIAVIVLVTGLVLFVESRHPASVASGPGGPAIASPQSPTALYGQPIKLPRAAVHAAQRFIQTAVLRKDVAASWALTTPAERAGFTRAQWATGNIPVVPFQREKFGSAKFKIDRSRERDILLEVLLTSKKLGVAPVDDFMELVPSGKRWLVTYFAPRGVNPPVPAAQP